MQLDNPQLLRIVAFFLEAVSNELSIKIFRQILRLRPEEPQSYRDLADTIISYANTQTSTEKKLVLYKEAIELLNKVILGKWDKRFTQIEVIAIMDLNRLVNIVQGLSFPHQLLNQVDHRLFHPFDLDIRVSIQWDTDMTDVELHVTEPNGEECYSFHNKTKIGGLMSKDFSYGYGPEDYVLRKAIPGKYVVSVKLFSTLPNSTGTTVLVKMWTNWARQSLETKKVSIVRLTTQKQSIKVGEINFL